MALMILLVLASYSAAELICSTIGSVLEVSVGAHDRTKVSRYQNLLKQLLGSQHLRKQDLGSMKVTSMEIYNILDEGL